MLLKIPGINLLTNFEYNISVDKKVWNYNCFKKKNNYEKVHNYVISHMIFEFKYFY